MSKENLEIWEKIFQENEWGKYPALAVVKFIARNFYTAKERGEIKILEIGAGVGANLWFCAREGFRVYAIDGSDTAISQMRERFHQEQLPLEEEQLKVGDYYEKLDSFEDEYFDAILDVESLYCNSFTKTQEIVQKAFKKLKPKGIMLSQTFADGAYGLEGEEIDYHALSPKSGPMAYKGFTRYTTRDDIDTIYKLNTNEITNIERQELHLHNGEVIKEWLIELKKH